MKRTKLSADKRDPGGRRAPWSREQRLCFIEYRALWEGRVNRSDLIERFSISSAQASLDLREYMEFAANNLEYDKKEKTYVPAPGFRTRLVSPDPETYLKDLLARSLDLVDDTSSSIGWLPPSDVVRTSARKTDGLAIRRLLSAMRHRSALTVLYQSMREEEPVLRDISPHAFAHDGNRWHVRAWCHLRQAWQDFLPSRMLKVRESRSATRIDPQADVAWCTQVEVVLAPHPELGPARRRAIEIEMGMKDGVARLPTRGALVRYVLRRHRLDYVDPQAPPPATQVILVNRSQLSMWLTRTENA